MKRAKGIIIEIILSIALTIFASYLILPWFLGKSSRHYNVNDVYLSIYVGLILSAVQLIVLFLWILFFNTTTPEEEPEQCV